MKALESDTEISTSRKERARTLDESRRNINDLSMRKLSQLSINSPEDSLRVEKSFVYQPTSFSYLQDLIRPLVEVQVRTNKDVKALYELVKDLKSFNEIVGSNRNIENVNGMMYLCKHLRYCSYPIGSTILKQNEPSDGRIYVVMVGELSLALKRQAMKMADYERRNTNHHRSSIFSNEGMMIKVASINAGSPIDSPLRNDSGSRSDLQSRNDSQNQMSPTKSRRGMSIFFPNPNNFARRSSTKIGLARFKNSLSTIKLPLEVAGDDENLEGIGTTKESSMLEPDSKTKILDSNDEYPSLSPNTKMIGRLEEGSFFGAKLSLKVPYRSAAVIANTDVELLYLEKEVLEHIESEFDRGRAEKINFLTETFATLDDSYNEAILEEILDITDIRTFSYQQTIVNEGDMADEFFCVYEGKFELVKTFIYDKSSNLDLAMSPVKGFYGLNKTSHNKIILSNLERGSIFGEETLFNDHGMYEYSVGVCSEKAKVFSFKKKDFLRRSPTEMLDRLKHIVIEKGLRNLKSINEKLLPKGIVVDLDTIKTPKPVILAPKTLVSYDPNSHQVKATRRDSITKLTKSMKLSPPKNQTSFNNSNFDAALDSQKDFDINDQDKTNSIIPSLTHKKGMSSLKDFNLCKSFIHINMPNLKRPSIARSSGNSPEPRHYVNSSYSRLEAANNNTEKLKEKISLSFKNSSKIQSNSNKDLKDLKFDFGRKEFDRFGNRKRSKKLNQTIIQESSPLTKQSKNFELSNLITLKLKEMGHIADLTKSLKLSSEIKEKPMMEQKINTNHNDQLYSLENSVELFHTKARASLKLLDFSKMAIDDRTSSACQSPINSNNFPDSNYSPLKSGVKARVNLSKITSAMMNIKKDGDLLPGIHSIKSMLISNHKRSASEQKAKFFGRLEF